MKSKARIIAVLLAAMVVFACAPFALAADGATITVQHGATKQFELYRKNNDQWNTVDTSYSYKDFSSATSGDEKIAKIIEQNGKLQIIGMSIGFTTYTATTTDGTTFTGYITVISPKPAEGGGGGSGLGGGSSSSSSYNGALFFPVGEKSFTVPVPQGAAAGGTWTSSNPKILKIDAKTGQIEALLPGNVTLTYTFGEADAIETRTIQVYVSGGDYYYEVRLFRGLYTGGGYNPYLPAGAQAPAGAALGSDGVYGRVFITVAAGKTNDITFSAEGDITIDPKTGYFEKRGDPTGWNQYTGRYEWSGIIIMNSPTMGVKHEHVTLF